MPDPLGSLASWLTGNHDYWAADQRSMSDHLRPPFPTPAKGLVPASRSVVGHLQEGFDRLPPHVQGVLERMPGETHVVDLRLPTSRERETFPKRMSNSQTSYYSPETVVSDPMIGLNGNDFYRPMAMAHELGHAAIRQWPDRPWNLFPTGLFGTAFGVPHEEHMADDWAGVGYGGGYGQPKDTRKFYDLLFRYKQFADERNKRTPRR